MLRKLDPRSRHLSQREVAMAERIVDHYPFRELDRRVWGTELHMCWCQEKATAARHLCEQLVPDYCNKGVRDVDERAISRMRVYEWVVRER